MLDFVLTHGGVPVEEPFFGQGRCGVLYGTDVVLDVIFVAFAFEFHFGEDFRRVERVAVDGVVGDDVVGDEFCFDVLESTDLHDPDEFSFGESRLPKRVEHLGGVEAESRPVGELVDVEHKFEVVCLNIFLFAVFCLDARASWW